MPETVSQTQVLIVGAGPTGLSCALGLARRGVMPRIVDQRPGPVQQSRAMGVQARTLELYRSLGLAGEALALGTQVRQVHLLREGHELTSFSLSEMGEGLSPYPFLLTLAQDVHEAFLLRRLEAMGITVEWGTTCSSIRPDEDAAIADLTRGGAVETVQAAWLVGCDGAHSVVRKSLGVGFPGGSNDGLFYVADVDTDQPSTDVFASFGEESFALLFPVRTTGTQRLIGMVPPHLDAQATFEQLRPTPEHLLGLKVGALHWFSTYHVSHRVAERFRVGRVFLAGDACHVHSPVGGQGMNTGIGDALNLAWKLAHVIQGRASDAVLDSYEQERIPFAERLIETTDAAFGPMSSQAHWAELLRTVALPNALRVLVHLPGVPTLIFRTISQTRITYRDGALASGRAGSLRGGDRLPWVPYEDGDNFDPLTSADWQLHVYGEPGVGVPEQAAGLALPLHRLRWTDEAHQAGLRRDHLYLVRPDGHLGLIATSMEEVRGYAERHGLVFHA